MDLRLKDVRLTHPPMVILTGKGRKVRQVPLMKEYLQTVGQIYPQLSFRFSVSDDSAIL
mgnify:CR=1 FL=1